MSPPSVLVVRLTISSQADKDIAAHILVDVVAAVNILIGNVDKKFCKLNVIVCTLAYSPFPV